MCFFFLGWKFSLKKYTTLSIPCDTATRRAISLFRGQIFTYTQALEGLDRCVEEEEEEVRVAERRGVSVTWPRRLLARSAHTHKGDKENDI